MLSTPFSLNVFASEARQASVGRATQQSGFAYPLCLPMIASSLRFPRKDDVVKQKRGRKHLLSTPFLFYLDSKGYKLLGASSRWYLTRLSIGERMMLPTVMPFSVQTSSSTLRKL
jgi:hypothetical protein